jgi:hypothetical protein
MAESPEVSLTIRAIFDPQREAVGLIADASEGFDDGPDTRAKVEVLAAITAKANSVAAEVIRTCEPDPQRRQELYAHYASLKEHMLNDMLQRIDQAADGEHPRS